MRKMLVVIFVCALVVFCIYSLGITEPKILPEWAYLKFFGLQVTEIVMIVFFAIGVILVVKRVFLEDR